jgi:hypothetical protein
MSEAPTKTKDPVTTPNIELAPMVVEQALKIETKEFKEWFGNSKVVDSNGEPIVAYHGTTKDFDRFNTKFSAAASLVSGIFWSTDPDWVSKSYAWSEGNSQIIPAWLSVKNPASSEDIKKCYTSLQGGDVFKDPTPVEVQTELMKHGFDGANFDKNIWLIFTPEQAKSTFNPGTFDAANPTLLDLPLTPVKEASP